MQGDLMPIMDRVTMDDFAQDRKSCRTCILPCGVLEEHGSHLPLGTDAFHAIALAEAVSERMPVWVAPPIYYGLCRSTSEHPGTVGIRGETLAHLVRDIIWSLYAQGMRQVVILSGHAGGTHMAVLADAGEQLLSELPEIKIAVLSVLDLGEDAWEGIVKTPGDSHAGEVETSVMLHILPELVKGTAPEEYPSFPAYILVRNKTAYWPGGVWGNPKAASRDKGRELMERSVSALIDLIHKLESWQEK
jgi:creatinine amidohydrolase